MTPTALPTVPAGPAAASCCAPAVDLAVDAKRIATVAKALAEPARVQVMDVLMRSDAPVCQCEFVALLNVKQSVVSHHIKKLTDAGLVQVERRHRWAYYSVVPESLVDLKSWLS